MRYLGLKIDFDTERGTRLGILSLLTILSEFDIKGTFLFSLGPDRTGRAITRIMRPGFFKKVSRTSVVKVYGIRTLLNGLIVPGPYIGQNHAELIQSVDNAGHEVGIHCYDHIKWQDHLHTMTEAAVRTEVYKAVQVFQKIFNMPPKTIGAAGWQASHYSLAAYDDYQLTYASDTRGPVAFFPKIGYRTFKTLQIPTTLPTLDELIGRPDYPNDQLIPTLLNAIKPGQLNVMTIHAELEGLYYLSWFREFLRATQKEDICIIPLKGIADKLLEDKSQIPTLQVINGEIDGRSGTVALSFAP